jgi:hypothetical protein
MGNRSLKRSAKKTTHFLDQCVLRFLQKLVELNFQEGDETTKEFDKLPAFATL